MLVNNYVGTWHATDQCNLAGQQDYEATITTSGVVGEFFIANFGGVDSLLTVRALIIDDDNFEIVNGNYQGVQIVGTTTGTIDTLATPNRMAIEYASTIAGEPTDTCTLMLTKL